MGINTQMTMMVEIGDEPVSFEVPFTLHEQSDPGIRTFRNGDPGHPPSCERWIDLDISDNELEEIYRDAGGDAKAIRSAVMSFLNERLGI
jgi:hypothetical protein